MPRNPIRTPSLARSLFSQVLAYFPGCPSEAFADSVFKVQKGTEKADALIKVRKETLLPEIPFVHPSKHRL
jgi:hypothetical protein